MKKSIVAAFSLAIALAAGSVMAAEPAKPAGNKHFAETDTDKDGSISKSEWQAKGEKMFGEIDVNKDGKLSPDEMKAHHALKRAEHEKRMLENPAKAGDAAPAKK